MCAKYYELRCMFYKKNCTSSKLARMPDTASRFALFSVSSLKDEKWIEKANLPENRNMQTLFWSLLNIFARCRQN